MLAWFLKSIGVGDEMIRHLDRVSLTFQYPGVLWAGLVLLAPVGWLLYRRQRNSLGAAPPALGIALVALRLALFALLCLVLASPYLKLDYTSEKKPAVAILLDTSDSMQLPAGPFEGDDEIARLARVAGYAAPSGRGDPEVRKALNRVGRGKLMQSVLRTQADMLRRLEQEYDVRYLTFDTDVTPLTLDDLCRETTDSGAEGIKSGWTPASPPASDRAGDGAVHLGGSATRLGEAVCQALDETGGGEMAGIAIITDGRNTAGCTPAEAACRAAQRGVPLFPVPAGAAGVQGDAAIADVFTSDLVSVGDMARVAVSVRSEGLDGKKAQVQLLDAGKVLSSKELVLNGAEAQQVDLSFEAAEAGVRHLTVQIPPLAEEPEYLRDNNRDTAALRVSGRKLRVLYLEGLPRWDFRFLKNAMRRDHGLCGKTAALPDIVLEAEWRRTVAVPGLIPESAESLAAYHAVIVGDASPRLLSPAFLEALAEAVRERGVGLIVMAGPLHMPHAFPGAFTDLLPVKLQSGAAGIEAPAYRPFRIALSPEGRMHAAMSLYDDADRNETVWARMQPYYWCAAVKRPAAGATVLAWNPDVGGAHGPLPLIAFHQAGQGRVMFVGTDSTWMWRREVGDRFFYKFWGQAIRFAARADAADGRNSLIETRPMRAKPGEKVRIELLAYDQDGKPRTERTLKGLVRSAASGGRPQPVELSSGTGTRGAYAGTWDAGPAGEYTVLFDAGGRQGMVAARVLVAESSEERRRPAVDRATLDAMAAATGGRVVALSEIGNLAGMLKGGVTLQAVHRERTVWDNWFVLVLLALIYSVDVGLRRLSGMA